MTVYLLLSVFLVLVWSYLVLMAYVVGLTKDRSEVRRLLRDFTKPGHATSIGNGLLATIHRFDTHGFSSDPVYQEAVDRILAEHLRVALRFVHDETRDWAAASDDKVTLALFGVFYATHWLVTVKARFWPRLADLRYVVGLEMLILKRCSYLARQ